MTETDDVKTFHDRISLIPLTKVIRKADKCPNYEFHRIGKRFQLYVMIIQPNRVSRQLLDQIEVVPQLFQKGKKRNSQ